MGQLNRSRLPVDLYGSFVLTGNAQTGGVEVGQSPQEPMLHGDTECDRSEKAANPVGGDVVQGMAQGEVS